MKTVPEGVDGRPRVQDDVEQFEEIDNIALIWDNVRHMDFELGREQAAAFRLAREAHQILLRCMVEALRGTANLAITGRPQDTKRRLYFCRDGKHWHVIEKTIVPDCRMGWRYSSPRACEEPRVSVEDPPDEQIFDDYLRGFYDLLAMIQAEAYMKQYYMSKSVAVSDAEMYTLEWLHERVRNEFEHFVPKLFLVHRDSCLGAAGICLKLSKELLFESGNVVHLEGVMALRDEIPRLMARIAALRDNGARQGG